MVPEYMVSGRPHEQVLTTMYQNINSDANWYTFVGYKSLPDSWYWASLGRLAGGSSNVSAATAAMHRGRLRINVEIMTIDHYR